MKQKSLVLTIALLGMLSTAIAQTTHAKHTKAAISKKQTIADTTNQKPKSSSAYPYSPNRAKIMNNNTNGDNSSTTGNTDNNNVAPAAGNLNKP